MEKRLGPFPSTPDGAPAPTLGERSGAPSGLRPSSFVICNTPVEVQFTSAGCLNYPCRTPAPSRTSFSAENLKMVEGRLRHYIDGKFKKIPELSCLMSSADSSWSGFLIERQKYDAGRLSEP